MLINFLVVLLALCAVATAQRPFYAGTKPIGYPDVQPEPTKQRLPLEAKGDQALVDRLSKLPVDKQPFWFINWRQYEDLRQNPQTYPLRPSIFNSNTS